MKNHFLKIVFLTMLSINVASCSECQTTSDCPSGQICTSGSCTNNSFGSDGDADGDTDGDTDSDSDADSGLDNCTDDSQCDDSLWCNGAEKCIKRTCQPGKNPCEDLDNPATPCKDESFCDEKNDICDWTIAGEDKACSEAQFCFGGKTKVCKKGLCLPPSTYTDPCPQSTECLSQTCDELQDKCIATTINENDACYEDAPCNAGICQQGVCDKKTDPCKLQHSDNPCMSADCSPVASTETGKPFTCVDNLKANNSPCNSFGKCDGTDAYCYAVNNISTCIEGASRPCRNAPYDIHTAQTCIVTGADTQTCELISPSPEPIKVSSGLNELTILQDYFKTREYYSYGSPCAGLDYRGQEAVLQLPDSCNGKTVTLTVSGTATSNDVIILHVTDYQTPSTCQAQGTNSLTVAGWSANDEIILESAPGYPQNFDLTVTCP